MGAQIVQQHPPQFRYDSRQASQAAHSSMRLAVAQAVLEQNRQIMILFAMDMF